MSGLSRFKFSNGTLSARHLYRFSCIWLTEIGLLDGSPLNKVNTCIKVKLFHSEGFIQLPNCRGAHKIL